MAEEQRTPITIEGLSLGDEGQLHHFNALASREEAAAAAKDLEVGDAAFIKRSDLKWTYAILAEKDTGDSAGIVLRFDVDTDKNRKSFPEKQWGKYIRCINHVAADKPGSAVEESAEVKEEETKVSSPVEKPEEKPAASASGWFSGIFGSPDASKQSRPTVTTNDSLKESVEMPLEQAVKKDPTVEEEPIKFGRSSSKQQKVEDAKSSKSKKEWFDPHASEVDYDKNPTDLFQALEARQWAYAGHMVGQDNALFKKDCSTWVVAKGKKKGAALRFRALPLHAAVVFGAPDNLTKAILAAYPLAAKGRDVKGRLPIHLACEHDVSDEVLFLLINAFPKAFYAKDKLEKTPLEYMNDEGNRKWIKKIIPSLISAKIEDEKAKWDAEKEKALIDYREALKSDPEFTKEVDAAVEAAKEASYASKFELVELTHKKEIELLKMKHAEETRALLEGFEVKLNFERKLQKLKA
eukprot:scaffold26656_cov149-Skeletonema_menzelii.AAC.24